jgi:hypothetical protein
MPRALKAIHHLATQTNKGSGSSSGPKGVTHTFAWVDTEEFSNAKTIEEVFSTWRWDLELGKSGVEGISFNGEKLGDDKILFDAIAPFVKPGSYLEIEGEDGLLWRWTFDGRNCTEIEACVNWEDYMGMVERILTCKTALPMLLGLHPELDAKIEKVLKGKRSSTS